MEIKLKKGVFLLMFYWSLGAYCYTGDSTINKIEVYYISCKIDYPGLITPEEFNNYDPRLLKREVLILDKCSALLKEINADSALKYDSISNTTFKKQHLNMRIKIVISFLDKTTLGFYLDSNGSIFYNGIFYTPNIEINKFLCSEVKNIDCFCN